MPGPTISTTLASEAVAVSATLTVMWATGAGAVASVPVRLMVAAWALAAPTMMEKAPFTRLMSAALAPEAVAVSAMIAAMQAVRS